MKRVLQNGGLLCACIALPPSLALATEGPRVEMVKRYVLIVANNRSQLETLDPLNYADDDGLLYKRLLSPFSEHVLLLTNLDDETQARHPREAPVTLRPTRAALHAALEQLFVEIRETQRGGARTDLVVVFVGHGSVDDEGKGTLHLEDGTYGRAELFSEVIAASPADFTHLIIDACHAYAMVGGRGEGAPAAPSPFESFLSGDDLENYPSTGVLVATSDDRETHEWSRIRAGIFSHQVRSALAGAADINRDGRVEYSEVAAFVGSANAGLAGVGKRITTFAWPPSRDRGAVLLDLRGAPGVRYVVLEEGVAGRFFFEASDGDRWAELHKSHEAGVVVAIPQGEAFYLRDGAHEALLEPGPSVVRIASPLTTPYALEERGALDHAFQAGLFAMPFSLAYYRGFVSARPHLVESPMSGEPFLVADAGEAVYLQTAVEPIWVVSGGYQLAEALLMPRRRLEHGVYAQVRRRWGERWELGFSVDVGYADLQPRRDVDLVRVGFFAGGGFRQPLFEYIALTANLDLGLSIVHLRGGGGTDGSVPSARLGVAVEGLVWQPWTVVAGGTLSAYLFTLDGSEKAVVRPGFFTGVRW